VVARALAKEITWQRVELDHPQIDGSLVELQHQRDADTDTDRCSDGEEQSGDQGYAESHH
jgi:hypothetical protein